MGKHIAKLVFLISIIFLFPLNSDAKWKASALRGSHAWDRASLALDQAGRPHIVYRDAVGGVLKHTYKNGARWSTEVVDLEDSGWDNAVAIDPVGHIHVSYNAEMEGTSGWESVLRYAYFDGTNWNATTVDHFGGNVTSITVDDNNMPRISYVANGKLRYAYYDGIDWNIEDTGFSACSFCETSIALTSSGKAYIGFVFSGVLPRPVYVANNVSGSWQASYLGEGIYVGLALDSQDYPHVVYSAESESIGFMYSRYNGSIWTTEIILTGTDSGYCETPDIAIDLSGHIHITFAFFTLGRSGDHYNLLYANYDNVSWNIEFIDKTNAGYGTSLVLDSLGFPHVSYLKENSGRYESFTIKYAYYKAPRKPK